MTIMEVTPVEHRRAVLRARAGSKTRRGEFEGCHPGGRDAAGHVVPKAAKKAAVAHKPEPSPLEKAYKQRGWRNMPRGQKTKDDESSEEDDTALTFKRKASSTLSLGAGIKVAAPTLRQPMYKRMKMGNRQK